MSFKSRVFGDFPSGPILENPPSNAGDACSIPGWGTGIPHAAGQLIPFATTAEPMCPGAHAPQLEKKICTPQLERSPQATTKTQCSQNF